jgi:outer membrane protein TolC
MRLGFYAIALVCSLAIAGQAARPNYGIDDAVALAKRQNLEIVIARKQIQAARGGLVEARSGYLPSLASTGLYDKREHQQDTRLRDEDYNVSRAGGRAQDATAKA